MTVGLDRWGALGVAALGALFAGGGTLRAPLLVVAGCYLGGLALAWLAGAVRTAPGARPASGPG